RDCHESSPQILTDSLKGKSISTDASSEPCSRRNHNDMIEELTLKKYPNPNFVVVGSSTNREAKSIRQSQWHHLYQLGGRSGNKSSHKENVTSGGSEKVMGNLVTEELSRDHVQISEHLIDSNKNPIISKVCYPQQVSEQSFYVHLGLLSYFVKNSLNGKGVVSNCPEARNGFAAANMNRNKEKSAQITRVADASMASPNLGVKADVTLPHTVVETDPKPPTHFKTGSDLEDVGKRHMLITQASSSKDPLRLEAFPRATSLSNMIEARLIINIDQLENAYFTMNHKNPDDRLRMFFDGLCRFARYSTFEVCETLRNADLLNSANVICSLSFDQDEDFFNAAGVSKKIKNFDFHNLLDDSIDIHYQVIELSSKSRLSCICWNNKIKNYLASTDYDGVVQIWDACTCQGFFQYAEHQKRAWSIDFSQLDPTKLASGSDYHSVKLCTTNERKSVSTIRNVVNVCCV
ncbi:hypothetical protein GIB67_025094, partial [Kingdonia uniflora]